LGKGIKLQSGKDVTLIATGALVCEALEASQILRGKGIEASVIDIHTIKPLDKDLLLAEAYNTRAFVVAEEHLIWGGLGSAVSQLVSSNCPFRLSLLA